MGTARRVPTIPLSNKPSFTSIARLDIPFSGLIEVLLSPAPWKNLGTVGPGTLAVDSKATPPHQKCLAPTWGGPRRHRASPEHPARGGLQSRWCEVVGHSPVRGTSHRQSSWPCFLLGRPLHDRRSSRFGMLRRHVAGCQ